MYDEIFGIETPVQFEKQAIDTFQYQYNYNSVYRRYVDLLQVDRYSVDRLEKIPFLPIRFFKSQTIISSADPAVEVQKIFTSSATTGMTPSRHFVVDLKLYEESFLRGFRCSYGDPADYVILALLPSYLEREGSSLVYMADRLIKESGHAQSGFYLYNYEELYDTLCALRNRGRKTLLLGVTFALLDFAEKYSIASHDACGNSSLIVMETGGMKGHGEELPREEVHRRLKKAFAVEKIHSEYGMCEMLSQAYSYGDGLFRAPAWVSIVLRDFVDSSTIIASGKKNAPCSACKALRGAINIIDLANINSCSFIETDDIGTLCPDGTFTIDGRLSSAERRGCNMLVE